MAVPVDYLIVAGLCLFLIGVGVGWFWGVSGAEREYSRDWDEADCD